MSNDADRNFLSLARAMEQIIARELAVPVELLSTPAPAPKPKPLAEPKREWKNTEPGVLAWLGTRWRIHYEPHSRHGDFALYDDTRLVTHSEYLDSLKAGAKARQRDLDELGVE